MLNVAASQLSGSDCINSAVLLKVPHAVGKLSEFMWELMDGEDGSSLAIDMSCIILHLPTPGFDVSPRGEVWKGPIRFSSSSGAKLVEYLPAACSSWKYDEMKLEARLQDVWFLKNYGL